MKAPGGLAIRRRRTARRQAQADGGAGGVDTLPRPAARGRAASGSALVPLDGATEPVGRAELRARMSAAALRYPAALRADVAVQRWLGRFATGVAQGDVRPRLRVRELSLLLGRPDGYRAELGRLRYAAATLGAIDGGRVEAARWGALSLAGFAGLLPDPIDGRPERGAARFGLELGLRGERLKSRPALALVGSGSVFAGRLDERRVQAQVALSPGAHHLSAYAEGAAFDRDNPWGRPSLDLTAAGGDVALRFGRARLGARFDLRKPERSYWLASALPVSWLCSTASSALTSPASGASPARCRADDTRYAAQAFGGFELGRAQLDLGGSWVGSSEPALGKHALGHATLRFVRLAGRYDLGLGGAHEGGSVLRASTSLRTEIGVSALDDRAHVGLFYRPVHRRYQASLDALWEHGTGVSLHVSPRDALALDLYGELRVGDVDVALVMLMMAYRIGS